MKKEIYRIAIIINLIYLFGCKEESKELPTESVIADFSASDTLVGKNQKILFTDLTSGNPSSWTWEFEGGTPRFSNEQNPEILYEEYGRYNVKLVSKNNHYADSILKEEYVTVENSVPVDFELTWQRSIGEFFKSESVFSFIKTRDGGYMSAGSIWLSNENTDVSIVKYNSSLEVVWGKIYSGNFYERGSSLIETNDGNYIVAGSTNSTEGDIKSTNGYYDIYLLKFDNNGDVIWQKSFGGSEYEGCENNSLIELQNGNLMVAGTSGSSDGDVTENHGERDLWLLNLKSDGTLEWEKSYGGSMNDYGRQIIKYNDSFIVGLKSNSNDGDFLTQGNIITLINKEGEIQRVTNLGGANYGKTIVDKNGGFISLIGNSNNLSDFEIIKISESGTILWNSTFGGSRQEFAQDIIQLDDFSLVILGLSSSTDGEIPGNYGKEDDIIVAKLNMSGKLLGIKNFGGSKREWANCILELKKGEYIINSSTASKDKDVLANYGDTGIDNWLIRIEEISK